MKKAKITATNKYVKMNFKNCKEKENVLKYILYKYYQKKYIKTKILQPNIHETYKY